VAEDLLQDSDNVSSGCTSAAAHGVRRRIPRPWRPGTRRAPGFGVPARSGSGNAVLGILGRESWLGRGSVPPASERGSRQTQGASAAPSDELYGPPAARPSGCFLYFPAEAALSDAYLGFLHAVRGWSGGGPGGGAPVEGSDRRRFFAVFHQPPVDSPEKAVRTSIIQAYRKEQSGG
jgi:hypothetical protein